MNDSNKMQTRKAWERPTLYRLDAADAQAVINSKTNDGMNNMS
jgi:hypothetical protein